MTLRPRGIVIWLSTLSLLVAGAAFIQVTRNEPTRKTVHTVQGQIIKVEHVEDPCVKDIHSNVCQNRTCIRLQDIGASPTRECLTRLTEGVVGGGGKNNPSGPSGGERAPAPGGGHGVTKPQPGTDNGTTTTTPEKPHPPQAPPTIGDTVKGIGNTVNGIVGQTGDLLDQLTQPKK